MSNTLADVSYQVVMEKLREAFGDRCTLRIPSFDGQVFHLICDKTVWTVPLPDLHFSHTTAMSGVPDGTVPIGIDDQAFLFEHVNKNTLTGGMQSLRVGMALPCICAALHDSLLLSEHIPPSATPTWHKLTAPITSDETDGVEEVGGIPAVLIEDYLRLRAEPITVARWLGRAIPSMPVDDLVSTLTRELTHTLSLQVFAPFPDIQGQIASVETTLHEQQGTFADVFTKAAQAHQSQVTPSRHKGTLDNYLTILRKQVKQAVIAGHRVIPNCTTTISGVHNKNCTVHIEDTRKGRTVAFLVGLRHKFRDTKWYRRYNRLLVWGLSHITVDLSVVLNTLCVDQKAPDIMAHHLAMFRGIGALLDTPGLEVEKHRFDRSPELKSLTVLDHLYEKMDMDAVEEMVAADVGGGLKERWEGHGKGPDDTYVSGKPESRRLSFIKKELQYAHSVADRLIERLRR